MIKSAKQALRIQNARVAQNKRFYAHAVRRWAHRAGVDLKSAGYPYYTAKTDLPEDISPMSDAEFKIALGIIDNGLG